MRIVLVQMAPFYEEGKITSQTVDANLKKSIDLINRTSKAQPDVVCFPEFSFTGPVSLVGNLNEAADTIPGRITETLGEKAQQYGLHVVTNLLEKSREGYFNTAVMIGPEGKLILTYRKAHLYPTERFLQSGDSFPVCEAEFGVCGLLVCYDLAFPEATRILRRKGAKIVFCPTMALDRTLALLKECARARAVENEIFVVVVNMVGYFPTADDESHGKSFLVHPTGRTTQYPPGEATFLSKASFKEIENVKEYWSPFEDRRPTIYGDLMSE